MFYTLARVLWADVFMFSEGGLKKTIAVFQELTDKRAQRLLQLSLICFLGIGTAALVASGPTKPILISAMLLMFVSGWLAWRRQTLLSATIFLLDLTVMLSVLVWVSGGIHDIGMLGYPMILVMAAILGNAYLFLGLLAAILIYCSVIAIMTVQGTFQMYFPEVRYSHVLYINIIFLVTGFGVYILVMDLHRLMRSLKEENARVLEREQMISRLANRDQLTDLHNRRYAEFHFDNYLRQIKKDNKRLAMLFLDLDNFKPVNDSLGHAAGDQVLRKLSQRLQDISHSQGILCRFGGDEFLWLKPVDYEDSDVMQEKLGQDAQVILDAASESFYVMENKIEISGSVGISIANKDGETFIELIRAADLAMYHAKSKGRNTYSFYSEELDRISVDKYLMLKRIREGLANNEFEAWYQPKVDLRDGKIISCEALIRWPQKDGSFIYPDQFIPLAESSGTIAELGAWILQQACFDCAKWQAAGFKDISVAVNVSYVQFRDSSLPGKVEQALRRAGLSSRSLELELTESLLIDDEDDIQEQLDSLNAMGINLAIDDFGTGYSNLGYLRQFNARCLKIDKSFVTALGVSDRDVPLVRAMVQMAHSLGLKIIAEGIEDEASMHKLIELGCDEGQGYFWSTAISMEKWLAFLQEYASPYPVHDSPQEPRLH